MRRKTNQDPRRAEFEALITPLLDALYGTALRLTRNPQEAEDLLQDACLKAYRFLDRFEPGTNFKAWMYKVLTNTFHSRYRKTQRYQQVRHQIEEDGHQRHILAQGPTRDARDVETTVLDHMLSEDIQAALMLLSPEFRMAIVLSDVEEFSYKEIAEIMDCPVGTVMSRLYRARRQLQQHLFEHARDRGFAPAVPSDSPAEGKEAGQTEAGQTGTGQALGGGVTDLNAFRERKQR